MKFPGIQPAFLTRHGSHAYGLNTPTSDEDFRGFFFLPSDKFFGLESGPETIDYIEDGKDIAIWEFRKFMRLVGSSNPNVIETLFTDRSDWLIDKPTPCGLYGVATHLANNKRFLLSKKVHKTFGGYAYQQFQKLGKNLDAWELPGVRKDAMHCARLILFMKEALETSNLTLKIDSKRRPDVYNFLMSIRRGQLKPVPVYEWAGQQLEECDKLAKTSNLREEPDHKFLNDFTISVLKEQYNAEPSDNY